MIADDIKPIDHESAIDKWISAKKLIFFCGAGVSLFSPSDLPSGLDLLVACYKSLEKQFNAINFPNVELGELSSLPLETLLDLIVDDITDPKYSSRLEKIAEYFQNILPNKLHFLIAEFISRRKDCHIITTNYDLGFEKALKVINNLRHTIQIIGKKNLVGAQLKGENHIFKIHGCSRLDEPQDIVLTTKQEASLFPQDFLNTLKVLFENSLVVFLGYSASEPDCLEALMNVSNFDAIWVVRDLDSLRKNYRAQVILKEAKEAFVVEDLVPFVEKSLDELNPSLSKFIQNNKYQIDSATLRKPFSKDRDRKIDYGIALFKDLLHVSSTERLLRIIIMAYSQIRNFDKVDKYLYEYKRVPNYSKYFYLFGKASIIRDKNRDWRTARDYFKKAAKIGTIGSFNEFSALLEQLGLESLLLQENMKGLIRIRSRLLSLIKFVNKQLRFSDLVEKLEWQRILARLQKNVVQNLSYQKSLDIALYKEALNFCEEGIKNSKESQDIQTRIEIERFKARIHYKFYIRSKDITELNKALILSEKSVRLFSLLGVTMGLINARRQFALILITLKRYEEAKNELNELDSLLINSPDKLSQIKLAGLKIYYLYQTRRFLQLGKKLLSFILVSRHFTEFGSSFKNIIMAIKWYSSWLKGDA